MRLAPKSILFLILLLTSFAAFAAMPTFNLTQGVTPTSRDIYWLHMAIFLICCGIGLIVFSVIVYAVIRHRKSKGHKAANFHSSAKIEILWAVIPFIILVLMAIPATIVLINMSDEAKADLNIKITGYQWKWKYDYLDQGISYFSNLSTPRDQLNGKAKKNKWYLLEVDKPLVVPIHKKIRFLVTSNDVIHSWWVPALGVKRDAIPGFVHEAWARIEKPGIYRGQCAELCGIDHAFMPIVVVAKTQEDFDKWAAQNKPGAKNEKATPAVELTKEELMAKGKEVYAKTCSVCHKENGEGMPPAFPALKEGKITVGPVKDHIDIVLNGKNGTAMQAFKDQLSNEELAAVITYERNSWGNDDQAKYGKEAGGIVQPADIAKTKGEKVEAPKESVKKPEEPIKPKEPIKPAEPAKPIAPTEPTQPEPAVKKEMPKEKESATPTVTQEQIKAREEQIKALQEYNKAMQEQTKAIREHTKVIKKHTQTIQEQTEIIKKESAKVFKPTKKAKPEQPPDAKKEHRPEEKSNAPKEDVSTGEP